MSEGTLYIVGTPIGNLGDITYRAIETLKSVDIIAAEDTRVTIKLLNYYNIKNNLISYHEHSSQDKIEQIINWILDGKNIAVVSDAGMPCISDPGEKLVIEARERGINITVVPGPCAAIAGLSISGLETGQFIFEGFLSVNKKSRMESLERLVNETRTMIFYEAPHKLKKTLHDLYLAFGDRKISIIKELTKIHENVMVSTLKETAEYFEELEQIRGEFVLVLAGKKKKKKQIDIDDALLMIEKLHRDEKKTVSEAVRIVSDKTGYKKNALYKLTLDKKKY